MVSSNKSDVLVAVGKQIRSVRISKGYTQETFAELAGLDRAYYGGIERGERNFSTYNLVRLTVALDVPICQLFPTTTELNKLLIST